MTRPRRPPNLTFALIGVSAALCVAGVFWVLAGLVRWVLERFI